VLVEWKVEKLADLLIENLVMQKVALKACMWVEKKAHQKVDLLVEWWGYFLA
jgi:hypothetical protein